MPPPRSERGRRLAAAGAWLVALAATALLAAYYLAITPARHLDSVFLFEAVEGLLRTGLPRSPTVASWPVVTQLMDWTPQRLCAADLPFVHGPGYNVLDNHAYFVLYPIAALAALVGAEAAFAILNALAHMLLVVLPVRALRRHGVGWLACAAFAVLVLCWPAWSQSAIGDYYLDRLYMPLMLGLLFALDALVRAASAGRPVRGPMLMVVLLALLAGSCTERAAIMAAGAVIYTAAVHGSLHRRKTALVALALVGAALVLATGLYFKLLYQGFEAGGSLLGNLRITPGTLAIWQPGFPAFAVVTLALLGGLGFLAGWRVWLLMLGSMLPNLLITIGGAELNGWSTHYHAMYIPFVVFAAALGWQRLVRGAESRALATRASLLVVFPLAAVVVAARLDPYTLKRNDGAQSNIVLRVASFARQGSKAPSLSEVGYLKQLADAVPQGARVSGAERSMPTLRHGRQLMLFPSGVGGADYLVVDGVVEAGEPKILQTLTFHPENRTVLDACMTERVRREGFRLVRELRPVSLLVLRRTPP
jgi:hypothetical protein